MLGLGLVALTRAFFGGLTVMDDYKEIWLLFNWYGTLT